MATPSRLSRTPVRLTVPALAVALLALPGAGSALARPSEPAAPDPSPADARPFEPGELLVGFEPDTRPAATADALEDAGVDDAVQERLPVPGLERVELGAGERVGQAAAELERQPAVRYAEPNYRYSLSAVPDDPRLGLLWGLRNIGQVIQGTAGTPGADVDAPAAWDVTTGDRAVRVGVMDDGVAASHPDLEGNVLTRLDRDFVDDDRDAAPPGDSDFHGTHVAGVIGAVGDNARGVTGVSWEVGLVPLRVFNTLGDTTSADLVEGYTYARRSGLDVVNASFGGPNASRAQRDAIGRARQTLFVVAAGNFASNNDRRDDYPCSYPLRNIVCVAATDQRDRLASFSNFGHESVDLAAPGDNVVSTLPARKFVTSMDDGFDLPLGTRWSTGGSGLAWGRERVDGELGLSDSPGARYLNDTDSFAASHPIDLRDRRRCIVRYEGSLRTGPGADRLFVEASGDGTTWRTLERHSGDELLFGSPALPRALHGQPDVQVRFRLSTDGSGRGEGVHLRFVEVPCQTTRPTYGPLWGTSFAAPHVAGAAALVKTRFPSAGPRGIRARLLGSVDPLPDLTGKVATGGRLDVGRALAP